MNAVRVNNLTIARFVAALLVYFHHSSAIEYEAMSSDFVRNVAHNGHVGVSFFFVLSGFVLAASNLERLSQFRLYSTLSFYWKRAARIVPLWLVVSVPFILVAIRDGDSRLIPYLTFTQAWSPELPVAFGLLAVAWTLSVEVFFYLTFPFIAAAISPIRTSWAGPGLIAIGLLITASAALIFELNPDLAALPAPHSDSSHRWLYRSPLIRLGEFIAGIGSYLLLARCNIRGGRLFWASLLIAFATILVVIMGTQDKSNLFRVMPYATIFVLIVVSLAQLEKIGLGTNARIPILLGEASFAFYLIHQFYFKLSLQPPLVEAFGLRAAQGAVLVAAICASVGLHLLIEAPSRTLMLRILGIRSSMPQARVIE